jgi:hypothetical protein
MLHYDRIVIQIEIRVHVKNMHPIAVKHQCPSQTGPRRLSLQRARKERTVQTAHFERDANRWPKVDASNRNI